MLGDIFHAWIGDDDDRELARQARSRLASLVRSGTRALFVFGNHDFMVHRRFAEETGVELLGESAVAEVGGTRMLLMHGDTLCTSDTVYQQARKKILRPHYLAYARMTPRWYRVKRAKRMLAGEDGSGFLAKGMEVDVGLAARLMAEAGAKVLVHGHVHAGDRFDVPGAGERWVLPSWPGGGGPGGWLEVGADGAARRAGGWAARA